MAHTPYQAQSKNFKYYSDCPCPTLPLLPLPPYPIHLPQRESKKVAGQFVVVLQRVVMGVAGFMEAQSRPKSNILLIHSYTT